MARLYLRYGYRFLLGHVGDCHFKSRGVMPKIQHDYENDIVCPNFGR
jgi:hypothetical protein